MTASPGPQPAWLKRQLVAAGIGIAVLLVLLAVAKMLHVPGHGDLLGTTLLCVLAGAALGGLLGSLASPKSSGENKQFKQVAAVTTSFLGGLTLAELFKLLGDPNIVVVLFDNDFYFSRLLLFVTSMAMSGIVFWAFRTYAMKPDEPVETRVAAAVKVLLDNVQMDPITGKVPADFTQAVSELAVLATKASCP